MKEIYILNCFSSQQDPIMKWNAADVMQNGMQPLESYKHAHPKTKVFVDTKINDFDFHLTESDELKDADIISVYGGSTKNTILYVLKKAQCLGKKVIVDLQGLDNLNDRIIDMDIYGADYIRIDNDDLIEL